ncbi:MAG: hypothetical protein V4494_00140 [Chlamydiota bacterium]
MLAILLSFSLLAADLPPSTSLSSSHAAYDGNALVLTGQVLLDHGMGKMHAERASLQKQEVGSDFPFALIELQNNVLLHLKNNASLTCSSANLDFTLLQGFVFSDETARVIFSDRVGKNTPLKITSNEAELTFSKQNLHEKKADYEIETVLAKNNVVLEYNTDVVLHTDRAFYKKISSQNKLEGTISAYSTENTALCRVTHFDDIIEARTINIDLLQGHIAMQRPHGTLASSFFPKMNQGLLQFQSDDLLWDQKQDTLMLQGAVYIKEEGIGDIATNDELHLTYAQQDKKRVLKSIKTTGGATMHYGTRQLISHGPIYLDRDALTVAINSPITDGSVLLEEQICFQEGEIKIYADKAHMEYSLFDGFIHPVSILLKDNVRLFSMNSNQKQRLSLADRLTYSPTTRTFILTATPGKKVLFQSEEDGMNISAQEVHITYDPETKQEKIQGVGNVQLKFSSDEINLIKKMFPSHE